MENHLNDRNLQYSYGSSVEAMAVGELRSGGIPILTSMPSNWVYCDSCRTLFAGASFAGKDALHRRAFLEPQDFETFESPREVVDLVRQSANGGRECRLCGSQMSARVGTFSYRKDYAIQQFQTIWHKAFNALRQSDGWLFIGYSMPEADFEFRQVLKSAELANHGADTRLCQVILKKDQAAAGRHGRFFGLSPALIAQDGLEAWVERHFQTWLSQVI